MSDPQQLAEAAALRALVEGLESRTGERFFSSLVQSLATTLDVQYAYVSELSKDGTHFQSRAGWGRGQVLPPFDVPARGPCEAVLQSQIVHHAEGVQTLYPHVQVLADWGAVSYCGVPLADGSGRVIGHLAVLDEKPMLDGEYAASIMRIFAARAQAEIDRLRMEQSLRHADLILRALVEGTAGDTGTRFHQSLVRSVARALGVQYVFVAEVTEPDTRVRTLAFWNGDRYLDNFEYALAGTPCEQVVKGELCHYHHGVQALFPLDQDLVKLKAESYLAVPLVSSDGRVLGHLAALDVKPMPASPEDLAVFRVFGARSAAELERQHLDAVLQENEERLRDLFDEAPIAYVHEGIDTRFIRANRTAMRVLGITPDQIEGTYGRTFIPDTPDAQRRLKEALDSIGRGTDTSGVVLELRRKDNGKPLWIQWWSRPDPSGTYTRTMFLDITDKVLMEREKARLEAQNVYLQEEIKDQHNFEELIGASTALKKVLKGVTQVAGTDSTVLITGETGTGKELIARAIHNLSARKVRPLVKVNCAAIPAGLIESELFGHEKGAFTGALARKIGRFELADGGTIFLDEIGELPLDLQPKLLRVLQEGEFERLGTARTTKVNVRVLTATNRNLEQSIRDGTFRSDLFYRLNVFPLHLPPLRERTEDIPLLVKYFTRRYSAKMGKKIDTVPQAVLQALQAYPWPGNIRELENVIERAVILSQGEQLDLGDGLPRMATAQSAGTGVVPTIEEMERAHILQVLEQTGWRVSGEQGAAKLLGLKPTTLEARMKKLNISLPK